MRRQGNCGDNVVAESFFSTLKTALLRDARQAPGVFATKPLDNPMSTKL